MTREEILAMQPCSELNMKVAEEVMGHTIIKDKVLGAMERTIYPKPKEPGYG